MVQNKYSSITLMLAFGITTQYRWIGKGNLDRLLARKDRHANIREHRMR